MLEGCKEITEIPQNRFEVCALGRQLEGIVLIDLGDKVDLPLARFVQTESSKTDDEGRIVKCDAKPQLSPENPCDYKGGVIVEAGKRKVSEELKKQYPAEEGYEIISEAFLRNADGKIVSDPETGEARRVDFVVVKDGKVVDSIELKDYLSDKLERDNYTDTQEQPKQGGRYRDVRVEGEGDRYEVHHMPADSASPLERDDGPAIKMDKEDHRRTASCGMSREAREYREQQHELIEQGKFKEALQMDIDDIHEKFGDKYDDAIAEMLEYTEQLEQEGKI